MELDWSGGGKRSDDDDLVKVPVVLAFIIWLTSPPKTSANNPADVIKKTNFLFHQQ